MKQYSIFKLLLNDNLIRKYLICLFITIIFSFITFFSGYIVSRFGSTYVGKGFSNNFFLYISISLFWLFLIIIQLIKIVKMLHKGIKCNGIIYKITPEYFKMYIIEFGYTYEDKYYYNNVKILIKNNFEVGDVIEVLIDTKKDDSIIVNDIFLK